MTDIYKTSLTPKDLGSDLNALRYLIKNMINNTVNTMLIVKVIAVNDDRLDVQTVIKDISNNREIIDTYPIYSVRYMQWQNGTNCIKMVPKVGDIGILIVSEQDTSGLLKDGESICQTIGKYNLTDGIYIGGLYGMNQEPTQFLEIKDNELNITGTGTINISAPTVNIKDATAINLGDNGLPIVRDGDQVLSGTTVIGTVKASSVITKSA